ncbi:MAG: Serine/threonine protein kinase [Chloroflexi bacterium]|nr:MAG: Serine/threonine protein kinase [Chloroflexota bacterium]
MADGGSDTPIVISHYRLDSEIGRGGMGAVYRATDLRDNSTVAVKLLRAELARDASYRERFEREAHVGALLRSPYTVHLTDYGFANDQYFLVMDFVDGQSLGEAIADGPLPVVRVLRIGEKVARALEEAEARGVVHRDIKPDNIMLSEGETARVLDFGIARQAGTLTLTVAGGFVGSFPYSSPEHATGNVDGRSDIYSLGTTLYQALVGAPPFSGTAIELIDHHRYTPMPEAALAGQPEVAVAILRRCLAKDPVDRYQSATVLAAALSNAVRLIEDGAAAETTLSAPVPAETVAAGPLSPAAAAPTAAAPVAPTVAADTPIQLRITDGRPITRLGVRTGRYRFDLRLRNEGTAPVVASLQASDPDDVCRFQLPARVETQSGQEMVVPLRVGPRKFRWRGGRVRREVSVSASGGEGPPQEAQASFDDVPPRWPMASGGFFALAAIVAVLVVAMLGGGGAGSEAPGAEEAVAQVSEQTAQAQSQAEAEVEAEESNGPEAQAAVDESEEPDDSSAAPAEEEPEEQGETATTDDPPTTISALPVLDLSGLPGGRIAFVSFDPETGQDRIETMLSDGSGRLTILEGEGIMGLAASPDGQQIAYSAPSGGEFDIWIFSAGGGDPVRVTSHPDSDTGATWSPDGSQIAFVSPRAGSNDIWIMNADGSSPVALTMSPSTEFAPAWSPDGTRIAYASDQDGSIAIFVRSVAAGPGGQAPAQGAPPLRLTDATANDEHPAWSPDGRFIAFQSDRDGNLEIYVMNADGSSQRRLTDQAEADFGATWSPDGSVVLFGSTRDGVDNLYAVGVETGVVTQVTNAPGSEFDAVWDDALDAEPASNYETQLSAIASQASADAKPFLDEIAAAGSIPAQLSAIENLWPEVIGIQSDALRQVAELTPPARLLADHRIFVVGLRALLTTQLGLLMAAQTGDPNRVGQANQQLMNETVALQNRLSPEYRALVAPILE